MWNNFVDRFAEIWRNRTMGRKYFFLYNIIELTKEILLLLINLITLHKTETLVKQLSGKELMR